MKKKKESKVDMSRKYLIPRSGKWILPPFVSKQLVLEPIESIFFVSKLCDNTVPIVQSTMVFRFETNDRDSMIESTRGVL